MKDTEQTLKLLNQIQENPESTQRELVGKLNMSLGKINFLIASLVGKGIIKIKKFKNSKKKKAYLYIITPRGMKEKAVITKSFLREKMEEYDRLKAEIDRLKAEAERPERDPSFAEDQT